METAGVYAREMDYLGRYVQFGRAGEKVIRLTFPESPDPEAVGDDALLDRIEDYCDGERDDFRDVPVGLTVPTDQRAVLEATREIAYGEQIGVERLVRTVAGLDSEDEADLATAREALAGNPVALVIPDHRVRDGPSAAPPAVEQRLRSIEGL